LLFSKIDTISCKYFHKLKLRGSQFLNFTILKSESYNDLVLNAVFLCCSVLKFSRFQVSPSDKNGTLKSKKVAKKKPKSRIVNKKSTLIKRKNNAIKTANKASNKSKGLFHFFHYFHVYCYYFVLQIFRNYYAIVKHHWLHLLLTKRQ
jgi:hypothetical protein